jgi:hypothetical protein
VLGLATFDESVYRALLGHARQLGLSTGTMRRRIRTRLDDRSAANRFQAGVQASRRGWL